MKTPQEKITQEDIEFDMHDKLNRLRDKCVDKGFSMTTPYFEKFFNYLDANIGDLAEMEMEDRS